MSLSLLVLWRKKKNTTKKPNFYLFVCIYIKIIYVADRSENKMFLRTAEVHLVFSGMTIITSEPFVSKQLEKSCTDLSIIAIY